MSTGRRVWTPLELIQVSAEYLAEKQVPSARLDAELLLAHVLKMERLNLYLEHERPLVPAELDAYRSLLRQRGQRVPLQLLVGETQLFDLTAGPARGLRSEPGGGGAEQRERAAPRRARALRVPPR
jgi:hypothetical protein